MWVGQKADDCKRTRIKVEEMTRMDEGILRSKQMSGPFLIAQRGRKLEHGAPTPVALKNRG